MTQTLTLHYLFDPLCGWCYGASKTIRALAEYPALDLRPVATGLFAGSGARPMKGFAELAWANDQRIAALSGQSFSAAYRKNVLGAEDAALDSTIATLAVTSVAETAPKRVTEVLAAIQTARYVGGKDVTSSAVVAALLIELGLPEASARVLSPDESLKHRIRTQKAEARALMARFGLQGVPALVAEIGGDQRALDANTLYAGPEAVLAALELV